MILHNNGHSRGASSATTCLLLLLRMAGVSPLSLGCLDSTTSDREILFTASSPYEEDTATPLGQPDEDDAL